MARKDNTKTNGSNFDDETINQVWNKATPIPGQSSDFYRVDKCKAIIQRNQYGNRNSQYGWEIDHINPVDNGGGDGINNLQPLHWQNNVSKSNRLNWSCGN